MSTVISMTTIPDRIAHIGPCLASLVAQGLPVHVWAVRKIARSATTLGALPDFLKQPGVHVQIVADRGPITKLLPALEAGFDTILTADDDCIYGVGWAAGLLDWAKSYPDAALGYRGRVLNGEGYKRSRLVLKKCTAPTRVDIITGVYGALYQRTLFDVGIFDEWRTWPLNDDLLIAAHLKRRGVARIVVPRRCKITPVELQRVTPLFAVNRRKGDRTNDKGLRVLGLEVRK